MSRDIYAPFDGTQAPVHRFRLKDGAGYRDMATAAVEIYIIDEHSDTLLAMRPGVIISPKNTGTIDLMIKGKAFDFLGDTLRPVYAIARLYYAAAMDGVTPATNLSVNSSFDAATGAAPARLPDNWTLQGARTATWDNKADGPAPSAVYASGTVQMVTHSALGDPDYIQQAYSPSFVAGEILSWGMWHRCAGGGGESANDNHAIFARLGSNPNTITRFRVGEQDWYFSKGSVTATQVESAATWGVDNRGTTLQNHLDEAFLFKGRWMDFYSEPMRIPLRPCARIPRASDQLAGYGSFEEDSNGDGLADAWSKTTGGPTFSIDKTPANVSTGEASQKVVLANHSGFYMWVKLHGNFKSGKTYTASVKTKTSGALTGGGGTGGFKVEMATDDFDSAKALAASTNLGTNDSSFTTKTAAITLDADRSTLIVRLYLNGQTGTMWIDSATLVES